MAGTLTVLGLTNPRTTSLIQSTTSFSAFSELNFFKQLQSIMDRHAAETHLKTQQWGDKKNTERAARG